MAFSTDHFFKLNTWGDTPAADSPRLSEIWVNRDTGTAVAAQSAAGYFNDVRDLIQVGDIIITIGSDGFRILLVATVPASGNVTVTNKAAA